MTVFNVPAPSVSWQNKALFLVWAPPHKGARSQVLARELGIERLHFVYCTSRRGLVSALFKYPWQAVRTLLLLLRERPGIVFVQSPPSLAVLFVYLYCQWAGAHYIIDAHSAAFQVAVWRRPEFLHRRLARRALTTIVTNERFQQMIQNWRAHSFLLRDIPTRFQARGQYPLNGDFNVAVVNSFSSDEPLSEILEAARSLPQVRLYVSGDKKKAIPGFLASAPANVHFTGLLPDGQYYALLSEAHVVMCLTTRDNTMQRGACEALSLGKPLITSDWPLLRDYFRSGAVHVANASSEIRDGILKLKKHYEQFALEVLDLRNVRQQEWLESKRALNSLIQNAGQAEERFAS